MSEALERLLAELRRIRDDVKEMQERAKRTPQPLPAKQYTRADFHMPHRRVQ